MAAIAQTSWLTQALRLLPSRALRVLDEWSYRLALRRAAKRRQARRRAAPAAPEYKLKPWRD